MTGTHEPLLLKCPVCNAGFRGAAQCSRCGSDLTALMRIAARAWQLRTRAREALTNGNLTSARRLSAAAWRLHHSHARSRPLFSES